MDTISPSVISVLLTTNNTGKLYDDLSGLVLDNESVSKDGDNVTLEFVTSERVIDNISVNFDGTIITASKQILGTEDKTGTKWEAVYPVPQNIKGLVSFSFSGYDPAGNLITYDGSNVKSLRNVTIDNDTPSVINVALSTDNSGKLHDNMTGLAIDNESVAKFGDNITLEFETSERVLNPKVTINDQEVTAVIRSSDKTGTSWQAVYSVKDNDTGKVVFSNFDSIDPAGFKLSYDSSITSSQNVTVDNNRPSVSSLEISTDNNSKTLFDGSGNPLPDQLVANFPDNISINFTTSERVMPGLKLRINGIERPVASRFDNGTVDKTGTQWQAFYVLGIADTGMLSLSEMDAYDPAGNLITFDPNLANKSVTMDNTPPKVTSVSLSTNNSGTLFNDLTGQARPNDLVAFYQDNVTLKFETSERVRIQPKVKINGDMKLATARSSTT